MIFKNLWTSDIVTVLYEQYLDINIIPTFILRIYYVSYQTMLFFVSR